MKRRTFVLLPFAFCLLTVAACGGGAAAPAPADTTTSPPAVEIGGEDLVVVLRDEISIGPLISGELKAGREATVRAELGGSVLRTSVDEGQAVRQGAVLAQIEATTQGDMVASAESDVRSAEHALDVARRELQRTESLVKAGALAERDIDLTRNAVTAAQAQLDGARARLANARKGLSDATVRSPMTGIVSRRQVNTGDVVGPGTELYSIIDPSSMRLEASVSSVDLADIVIGAPVVFEVRGYPDQQFEGRIERISPTADSLTRQVPIFVSIPNKGGRLLAGLFAEGRVTKQARQTLVVPESAVNTVGPAPWVAMVRGGKAERVNVQLGLRDPQTERVELVSGAAEGDQLLVGGAQGITPGTPVTIRREEGGRR
jgi:RND family efflux transporter MFP subunit